MKQLIKTQITSICMLFVSVFGWGSKVRNVDENKFIYSFSSNVSLLDSCSFNVNSTLLPAGFSPKHGLFKIQKSKDTNKNSYDINQYLSGNLKTSFPFDVYKGGYSDSSKYKALKFIQKANTYGLKFLSEKNQDVSFRFDFLSPAQISPVGVFHNLSII